MVLRLNNVTDDVFLWSMTHVCSHRCKSVAMGRNAAMSNFPLIENVLRCVFLCDTACVYFHALNYDMFLGHNLYM